MNAIPRDGGNTFRFDLSGNYANHHMASNNLNDELRARGVTST